MRAHLKITLFNLTLCCALLAEAMDQFPSLNFRGASITRGFRAGASLESRYERQLMTESESIRAQINSMKTLVALDYFFVTNFSALRSGSEQLFSETFEAVLHQWLTQHDAVIVGLLPVEAELSAANREFLHSTRGRAFAGPFALISSCCNSRAMEVNRRLRALAATEGKLHLFDWTLMVDHYRVNVNEWPSASSLFADRLHINQAGQKVLYNLCFKSVLERVWRVSLRLM